MATSPARVAYMYRLNARIL